MRAKYEKQEEFFEEFRKPKKGIERLREKYISQKRPFFTVSVENLILTSISIIMVVVLFFSLGVERGKYISKLEPRGLEKEVKQMGKDFEEPLVKNEVKQEIEAIEEKEFSSSQQLGSAKYTVQVVTYRDETVANRKVASLEKGGLPAFIIPKGNLFQICIGKYNTLEEARIESKKLRNQYSDCFPRSIND